MITTKIISSKDGFKNLEGDWKKLYKEMKSPNPFLSWQWTDIFLDSYSHQNFIIIVVLKNYQVKAIAPFYSQNRCISFLSDSNIADYADLMIGSDEKTYVQKIFNELIKIINLKKINLSTLQGTSSHIDIIKNELSLHFKNVTLNPIHINPYINLSGNFDSFFKSRQKSLRSEMVRTKNSLTKVDKTWTFVEANNTEDKEIIFDSLVKMHLSRQTNKVGTSIFSSKKNKNFFKSLIYLEDLPWNIHLAGIKVNNEFITASLSIVKDDIFYYWIPSLIPGIVKGSIGNYHIYLLLEKCYDKGIYKFDFMGGNEQYKMKWTDKSYTNYQIVAYNSAFIMLKDKAWHKTRTKLQTIKDSSKLIQRLWVFSSKFLGK